MERRTIYFSGSVQGVGFRWTTQRCLEGLPLKGYVRNLADGRVELVLEGEAARIDEAVRRVRVAMTGYIRDVAQQSGPASGEFHDFGIRL
ncbi:MAG: acylphosphatase [Planctomycetota bacterium]